MPQEGKLLVTRFRLPELDLVALRVDHPGELAVEVFNDFAIDRHTGRPELREKRFEVADAVVEHERRITRSEVLRRLRKQSPDRCAFPVRVLTLSPEKQPEALAFLQCDAQFLLIP